MDLNLNLNQAAEEGNINTLYAAIRSDPFILDNIDKNPFIDTPLHIAASTGQTHFALEIMILKPSFARKLSYDGYSPMHLAVNNKNEHLLIGMLARDKDLARLMGKEGKTPMHCVAIGGKVSVLRQVLSSCGDSIEDLTIRRETALHLAAIKNQNEASGLLVEFIKSCHKEEIYWRRDEEGRTVLHYVTMGGQLEVKQLPRENRDALLVLLAVVNTTAFQFGINPPGGFWQDNAISEGKRYYAGTPILATTSPVLYTIISFLTSLGFVISFELGLCDETV